jgi:hypothetical protein
MKKLKFKKKGLSLNFVGNQLHDGHDFYIHSNGAITELEILIFLDSRGISKSYETSLAKRLINYFDVNNYLIIVRPIEITILPTLYNFLCVNEINPDVIITNTGFVDCTPKKVQICNEIKEQIQYYHNEEKISLIPHEYYKVSNGKNEMLYSIEYSKAYIQKLNNKFSSQTIYVIKTPLVDSDININRKRPMSFYKQLKSTNNMIDKLDCNVIEVGDFNVECTYDAVHWTKRGSLFIFNKIINGLKYKNYE